MIKSFFLVCVLMSSCLLAKTILIGEWVGMGHPYSPNPARRGSEAPYLTCDTYRSIASWCIDETKIPIITEEILPGDIIYTKTNLLDAFFSHILPHINVPFILLSTDDDTEAATHHQQQVLNNPYLKLWATANCTRPDWDKVIALPLGLVPGYHRADPAPYKALIERICQDGPMRDKLCLTNFHAHTHPRRQEVLDSMQHKEFVTIYPSVPQEQYLSTMAQYKFCVSPRGNGMDCFRHWECLTIGTIPIIERSFLDPLFYRLPVLLVDRFDSLTQNDLEHYLQQAKEQTFDLEKVYAPYWLDFLTEMQTRIRNGEEIAEPLTQFKQKTYGL